MTRGEVNEWVGRAKRLLADGDCSGARTAVAEAWAALGEYSASLARVGASNGTALYLHKTISTLQTRLARMCPANPNELATPTFAVQPRHDPDELAPIHGVGDDIYDSVTTTLTTLGMIGAVFGLGYGIYITYKRSGGA
jgi:hypothetical protein